LFPPELNFKGNPALSAGFPSFLDNIELHNPLVLVNTSYPGNATPVIKQSTRQTVYSIEADRSTLRLYTTGYLMES
jgi:hypothetical protein